MDQQPSSKQTLIIGILSGALIISLGISSFLYYQNKDQFQEVNHPTLTDTPQTVQSAPAQTSQVEKITTPDHATAFKDLYGITAPNSKAKISAEELSSFWFEQSFRYGNDNLHVVFFKIQETDDTGEPFDGHAQGVDVGAITYKQVSSQWQIASKQAKFGQAGSWGDVSETQAEILQLSPAVVAFMIDSGYTAQGYVEEGKILFAYAKNTWRDIGYVQTGGDNSGDCDDEAADKHGLGPCWSYQGKISVVAGKNTEYPNILIMRTGTEAGERASIIPAKNITYIFDGGKYVNPAEEDVPPVSANTEQSTKKVQFAQNELDEANRRINIVWNATTRKIRATLLPEQRAWLKQRENDCIKKASVEQPNQGDLQETIKLHCMAIMTLPRTELLKQKIAVMARN